MSRDWWRLGALVVVLLVLMGLRVPLQAIYESRHPRHEAPRYLTGDAPGDPASVTAVVLKTSKMEARYERDGDQWVVPMAYGAPALADRLDGLVGASLGSLAFEVQDMGQGATMFGFPSRFPEVVLLGSDGTEVLHFEAGLVTPGWTGRNGSYARRKGEDAIYHLSGIPISFLGVPGEAPVPMLDTSVLPRASLPEGQVDRVRFLPEDKHPIQAIERKEIDGRMPGRSDAPRFEFTARTSEGRVVLNERNAGRLFAAIRGLRFIEVLGPEQTEGITGDRIVLEFRGPDGNRTGRATLEVRGAEVVQSSTTRLRYRVVAESMTSLFPSVEDIGLAVEEPAGRPGGLQGLPPGTQLPPEILEQLQQRTQP